jgi:hypothetical protein
MNDARQTFPVRWATNSVIKRYVAKIATFFAISALIVGISLPVSLRVAHAYPYASGLWDSGGCQFSGYTAAYSNAGFANTYRYDSCATYAMVYLDYKTGGSWYGPYYSYQYNDYTYAASYVVYLNVTDTYSGHQIYWSGAWRQIENLINFSW